MFLRITIVNTSHTSHHFLQLILNLQKSRLYIFHGSFLILASSHSRVEDSLSLIPIDAQTTEFGNQMGIVV